MNKFENKNNKDIKKDNIDKKNSKGLFFKNIVKYKRLNGETTGKLKSKSTAFWLVVTAAVVAVFGTCVFALGNYNRNSMDIPSEPGMFGTDVGNETSNTTKPPDSQTNENIENTADFSTDAGESITSERVSDDYFDNSVFIGDSISYGLELYVTEKRAAGETVFGDAKFLTSGSLSYANSLWDVSDESVHPTYLGEKMKLETAVGMIQPDKIYILLGTNDVALYGVEATIQNADTEISRLLEASPGSKIIIQSVTPKYISEATANDLDNEDIDQLNEALKAFAEEKNYTYLDIAQQFKDENGNLAPDYCSDKENMGIHFSRQAYDMWIEYLYTHQV